MDKLRKQALINSGLTFAYILLLGLFFYLGGKYKIGQNNYFLTPVLFLSLFVFSAALTSYLMFGKPVMMYIDGKKKEAISLLINTIAFFFVFTLISLILLVILPKK